MKSRVALVRYKKPLESVKRAFDLANGLEKLASETNVFIKPNIPFWSKEADFPKWGVITTSRVVEDVVALLNRRGLKNITIGEGTVILPKDKETPAHAFKSLGYNRLGEHYGVRVVNIHERPFEEVDLGGFSVKLSSELLHSDLVIDLPVLKTHAQAVVSLGMKNLKGTLDIESRKKMHTPEDGLDLHSKIAKLPDKLPPIFTLIDGIFTLERGPGPDGRAHRKDILIASKDLLSADMVGAKLLGYEPSEVPHLVHAAKLNERTLDLSDVEIIGERIEDVVSFHQYDFPYNEDGSLHMSLVKRGVKGLTYHKYDSTMCTYCSTLNGAILIAINNAWNGEPWADVEVLTGKVMRPTPGHKKTILLGKCMYNLNKDDPNINELIAVRGCPPSPKAVVRAFHRAGINIEPSFIENIEAGVGFLMFRYADKPEFDESFFEVDKFLTLPK